MLLMLIMRLTLSINTLIVRLQFVLLFLRFVITGESGAGKTVTANVVMKMPAYGGHVGFYGSDNTSYTEKLAVKFLAEQR